MPGTSSFVLANSALALFSSARALHKAAAFALGLRGRVPEPARVDRLRPSRGRRTTASLTPRAWRCSRRFVGKGFLHASVFPHDGHWPRTVQSMPLYYAAHLDWFHRYLGGEASRYSPERLVRGRAFE
jgi:hypothetical protein